MSRMRQRATPEASLAIRSLALRLPRGHCIGSHSHAWPQLIYATAGVMTVRASGGTWVVPPQRAVWVPAGSRHEIEITGRVAMRTLYLRPGIAAGLPRRCFVVNVSPLLRELVLHIVALGMLDEANPEHARLVGVVVDQITRTDAAPLELRLPVDPRARRIADRICASPARAADGSDSLCALAQGSGASRRTLERIFVEQTGMSFGRWRQQVRLLHALRALADGSTVTQAGLDVGYESTSAFIAMFKRVLGTTPGRYYARVQE